MKLYLNSILIVAIFLVYHTGSAQTEFGIKGGVNYTFFKVNQASFGNFSKAETGYLLILRLKNIIVFRRS